MSEPVFYLVLDDESKWPTDQHLEHGYENEWDYYRALRRIVNRWKGRTGELIGERDGFMCLRFHDTPGGKPDMAWVPDFLLQCTQMPDYLKPKDAAEEALDQAFGFD